MTTQPMLTEKPVAALSGWPVVAVIVAMLVPSVAQFILAVNNESAVSGIISGVLFFLASVLSAGLFIVNQNEAKVVQLLGSYAGTARTPGLWWMNPLCYPKRKISQRIRNFESSHLKVNEHDGNPIEIAAVVVWNVVDTAEALFEVNDYENFVKVQTEAAIRNLATSYTYESNVDSELALRRNSGEITDKLRGEIQARLSKAGIHVIEARISHLAYAPEIAGAMLRRQQANAIVAARARMVDGAVGMVEMALEELSKKNIVNLDDERKAAMVSNLLVVLCSDQHTQPVVNTGSLYQ